MVFLCLLSSIIIGKVVSTVDSIDLFTSGISDNSWSKSERVCYRIPSLLKINSSHIIAFASERLWKSSEHTFCSDESASNIVSRRSIDGGLTWQPMELVIPTGSERAERHPWTLFDEQTQRIFAFTNNNVANCTCNVVYTTSDDYGLSWNDQLTPVSEDTGYYGMALAHGIQHTSGRLVGCMRKICRNSCPEDYHSKSYYSDDHGVSWSSSEWLAAGTTECQLVELSDHRLYLNSRPYKGWEGEQNVRLVSYSADAGSTWSDVVAEPNLIDFGFAVEGSMASDVTSGVMLYLHPMANIRRNITLYHGAMNDDGVVLWDTANTLQIYPGISEYSDVIVLSTNAINSDTVYMSKYGTAGVLFERQEYHHISFAIVGIP